MNPSVVCGVDHSANARTLAAFAADLAERLGLRLVLVHAVPVTAPAVVPSWPVRIPHDAIQARDAARDAGARLLTDVIDAAGVPHAVARVVEGSAPECLGAVAEQEAARLLVIGTHGEGAAHVLVMGSVSLSTTRMAPCPVVVLPHDLQQAPLSPPDAETIVCGVADADDREPLRVADSLAGALGLRPLPAHAVPGEQDDRSAGTVSELRQALGDGPEILVGDPAAELQRLAEEARAAMVVVGSRGRGAVRASLLGSVSRSLTCASKVPVVVCPPGFADGDERA